MHDQRTAALLAQLGVVLATSESEIGAIAAELSVLLQRAGQTAQVVRETIPIVHKLERQHKRKAAPVAAEAA